MPLQGKYTSHEIKQTARGNDFAIAELEYNDKPWEGLSTFDSKIIEVLGTLQSGEAVDFETKKSKDGKYQNLVAIAKQGDTLVKATRETSTPKGGADTGSQKKGPFYTPEELLEIRYMGNLQAILANPNVDPLKSDHINEIRTIAKVLAKEPAKEDFFK